MRWGPVVADLPKMQNREPRGSRFVFAEVGAPARAGRGSADGFLNAVRADAAGADVHPASSAVDEDPDPLEIRQPAPAGDVMGVTDLIAKNGGLAADFALFRHADELLRVGSEILVAVGSGRKRRDSEGGTSRVRDDIFFAF